MRYIAIALIALGILALTGWVYYLTNSPYSFLILLLLIFVKTDYQVSR